MYSNIRGLLLASNKTKIDYIRDMVIEENIFAVEMTETWLKPHIKDAEVEIKGFRMYRSDRVGPVHGGVCIYIRNDVSAALVSRVSTDNVDGLVIKIKEIKTILCAIYMQENMGLKDSQM